MNNLVQKGQGTLVIWQVTARLSKLSVLPSMNGTMYNKAGCPCPSIKFKATYVTRRPAVQIAKQSLTMETNDVNI